MAAIDKIVDGAACRACGAVRAPAHANRYALCDNCWHSLLMFSGAQYDTARGAWDEQHVTEESYIGWLAAKLVKDVSRFKRTGVTGRCEALSGWTWARSPGHQCALPATQRRDNHNVCNKHANALTPVYVDDSSSDYYSMFRDVLTDLAATDPRFAQIIREIAP